MAIAEEGLYQGFCFQVYAEGHSTRNPGLSCFGLFAAVKKADLIAQCDGPAFVEKRSEVGGVTVKMH